MPAEGVARETSRSSPSCCASPPGPAPTRAVAGPSRRATPCPSRSTGRPNTNHTGSTWRSKLGYYAAAGLDVKILPYAEHRARDARQPPQGRLRLLLLGRGRLRARGRRGCRLGLRRAPAHRARDRRACRPRATSRRPKDLDGKTYAGFGTPDEKPLLQTVIRDAGGKGVFKNVTLNTSAYDAVYRGKADFTAAARDLGGHPGPARGQAAEDVQARALRRPARVLRPDRLEQRLPAGRSRARAPLPGRHRARLPVRRRPPARRRATS